MIKSYPMMPDSYWKETQIKSLIDMFSERQVVIKANNQIAGVALSIRNCARARAIENECYVAIEGSAGNLPKVHNMDINYAQALVFTPCDFAFPAEGIKAEATPNTEMILIADDSGDAFRALLDILIIEARESLKKKRSD